MANPEIVFDYSEVDEDIYVETMRRYGAVIIRGYLIDRELHALADQIMSQPFQQIDQMHGAIREQFGLQEWTVPETTGPLRALVERSGEIVRHEGIPWLPTAVRAQLYYPGKSGVEWHRDFKSSLLTVGVMNVFGEARFDVDVEGEEVSTLLTPGDFALLRNTGVNIGVDDRVRHRVHAPERGERLSLGIRQE